MNHLSNPYLQVRTVKACDAANLALVFEQAVMAIETNIYTHPQKLAWVKDGKDEQFWRQYIMSHEVLGAWRKDQQLLGFSCYQPAFCYLDMLFVAPSAQGQGIARVLWQTLLERYTANNPPRIFTHASQAAKPFFSKVGFIELKKRLVSRHGESLLQSWMMRPAQVYQANKNYLFEVQFNS